MLSQSEINIRKEWPSSENSELASEQAYLTMLYARLDALRAHTSARLTTVRLDPTAENDQAASERESFVQLYEDRSTELRAAERNLCFGRLDLDDGERFYVGRLGLRSEERQQLLVDWRAPAAQAFYRATAVERYGVTRRRHLQTAGRRVLRLDDDVLDLDSFDPAQLAGEAALLASLQRHRTGRMGDIVATIQGDQDRIIRDDLKGILVVEGGPGTGKTVVALHRAAYLLYTYRQQLSRRGILVVGPNNSFMQYIEQVLPSLGENEVVLATVGSLFPGVVAEAGENPESARIKGQTFIPEVLARAVAGLERVPQATLEIAACGTVYRLTPELGRQAREQARRRRDPETGERLPHNVARRAFTYALLGALAEQASRDAGERDLDAEDVDELRVGLANDPAIRRTIDVLWPEFTPQQLLTTLLYAQPELLDLPDSARSLLRRERPGTWTPDDVPLLDELAELLGPTSATERVARAQREAARTEREELLEYAEQLVGNLAETEAIFLPPLEFDTFVEWVAGRNSESAPADSLAERASTDRTWAYGHVVVDEAQELSPMAWRMLLRRCPSRSMTVVDDLAQTGAAGGADSWADVLDPLVPGRWRTARLSVNYRTPKPAMALAAALLPPNSEPPLSVREGEENPWYVEGFSAEQLAGLVHREAGLIGNGRVAVVAPPALIPETAAALGIAPGADHDAQIVVLTPTQTKGLEFDSVVVVDPGGIATASARGRSDLYVALTRTTNRLGLIVTDEPPAELREALAAAFSRPRGPAATG
jgi:DNA helicase IV